MRTVAAFVWTTFGLATLGLALIAFWIGRRVGRGRGPQGRARD